MPSNFYVNSVDLDSIFAPIQSGMTPTAPTGYTVNGADLNSRYAPLTYGSAAGVTNYKVNSADLNTLFAAFGSTNIVILVGPSNVSGSAAAGSPSGTVTSSIPMTVSVSGGHPPYTYTWVVSGGAVANSPNSPTTFISATVNASSTLSGTAYCTIYDSTGRSVNTSSASWLLSNTSVNEMVFSFRAQNTGGAIGYGSPTFYGSGNPATPEPVESASGGQQLIGLVWEPVPNASVGSIVLTMYALNGVEIPASFVTTLTLPNTFGGSTITLSGASAAISRNPNTNYTQWTWEGYAQCFVSGTTYNATVVYSP